MLNMFVVCISGNVSFVFAVCTHIYSILSYCTSFCYPPTNLTSELSITKKLNFNVSPTTWIFLHLWQKNLWEWERMRDRSGGDQKKNCVQILLKLIFVVLLELLNPTVKLPLISIHCWANPAYDCHLPHSVFMLMSSRIRQYSLKREQSLTPLSPVLKWSFYKRKETWKDKKGPF